MKQEALDRTGNIQAPSVRLHLTMWSWGAAIALTLALTVIFSWQFDALSPTDKTAISNYLMAIGVDGFPPS